jgi:hypothetical protein
MAWGVLQRLNFGFFIQNTCLRLILISFLAKIFVLLATALDIVKFCIQSYIVQFLLFEAINNTAISLCTANTRIKK